MHAILREDLLSLIQRHAAQRSLAPVDPASCSPPDLPSPTIYHLDLEEERAALAERGIHVRGEVGGGNRVILNADGPRLNLFLHPGDTTGHLAIIGPQGHTSGSIHYHAHDSLVCVAEARWPVAFRIEVQGDGGAVHVGHQVTSNGVVMRLQSPDSRIVVGDRSMFSWGISVETGSVQPDRQPPQVSIGRRIWAGQDVSVRGSIEIGSGAILAARAIVDTSIPPLSLAAGRPARVVRDRVIWSRVYDPDPAAIDKVVDDALAGAFAVP